MGIPPYVTCDIILCSRHRRHDLKLLTILTSVLQSCFTGEGTGDFIGGCCHEELWFVKRSRLFSLLECHASVRASYPDYPSSFRGWAEYAIKSGGKTVLDIASSNVNYKIDIPNYMQWIFNSYSHFQVIDKPLFQTDIFNLLGFGSGELKCLSLLPPRLP